MKVYVVEHNSRIHGVFQARERALAYAQQDHIRESEKMSAVQCRITEMEVHSSEPLVVHIAGSKGAGKTRLGHLLRGALAASHEDFKDKVTIMDDGEPLFSTDLASWFEEHFRAGTENTRFDTNKLQPDEQDYDPTFRCGACDACEEATITDRLEDGQLKEGPELEGDEVGQCYVVELWEDQARLRKRLKALRTENRTLKRRISDFLDSLQRLRL